MNISSINALFIREQWFDLVGGSKDPFYKPLKYCQILYDKYSEICKT